MIIGSVDSGEELRELSSLGYNARGVKDTLFSASGIKTLNSYNLKVTESSDNLISSLEGWFWALDSHGNMKQEPEGVTHETLKALVYVTIGKALWQGLIPTIKKVA